MATRINIAQAINFNIHDGIASAQRWEKLKQRFEFYLSTSDTDDHSQMRALLLHCAKPDVHNIFMHLQDAGTTYKVVIDATLNHFYLGFEKKIVTNPSKQGLGAVLGKQNTENSIFRAVALASCSLSDAETRYSQTEPEALAVVFSCE